MKWKWRPTGWEAALIVAILADIALNAWLSPYFLNAGTLSDATFNFTEKGLVALPLALLIIAGEIDISIAGTMALSSVVMGLCAQAGLDTPLLCLVGLAVGLACGALNGALVCGLGVPSIVATIGTMSLFRGAAYAILGDHVLRGYPSSFAFFGQGYAAGLVSFELVAFVVCAVVCGLILHGTVMGRRIFAVGANPVAARFSGIGVRTCRFWLFVGVGAAAGLASILLTSRIGSTRPAIAQGWELDIISIAILGGVSVAGGKGTILGVVLAAVLVGFATFGLSVLNVPGVGVSMLMGLLLLVVVAAPRLRLHRLRETSAT